MAILAKLQNPEGRHCKAQGLDPYSPRSVLGILFTFWVMGFLMDEQKGSFFLPRGTGIQSRKHPRLAPKLAPLPIILYFNIEPGRDFTCNTKTCNTVRLHGHFWKYLHL